MPVGAQAFAFFAVDDAPQVDAGQQERLASLKLHIQHAQTC